MSPEERKALADDIAAAFKEGNSDRLTAEEAQWVKLAIAKEAQSIKLRQAIIEKTLSALIWAGVVGLAMLIVSGLRNYVQFK